MNHNKKVRKLTTTMRTSSQTSTQSLLEHGKSVHKHFKQLLSIIQHEYG